MGAGGDDRGPRVRTRPHRNPGRPLRPGGGDAPGQACCRLGPGAGTREAEEGAAAVGGPSGPSVSARARRPRPAAPARRKGRLSPSPVPRADLAPTPHPHPRPGTHLPRDTATTDCASAAAPGLVRATQTRSLEEILRTPANHGPRLEAGREQRGLPPIWSAPPEAPRPMTRRPV